MAKEKVEAKLVLDRDTIRKIANISNVAQNTGTYMQDVAKLARAIPKDATHDDLALTAKEVASVAGRASDKMFASRTLVILECREHIPTIVSGLKERNMCSREHVLSACRWIRKDDVSASVAVSRVLKGKKIGGAKAKPAPLKKAIKAVEALIAATRGERRETAQAALNMLAKLEA